MNDNLLSKNYVVAFVDVLGAAAWIRRDVDGSLNTVHRVYEKSLALYNLLLAERINLDISIFSDNIVMAREVDEKCTLDRAFKAVHLMAAIIQGNFLFEGVLSRGGIAYGKFYIDDLMVWGDALTSAYHLESTVAIFPRIVIDPKLAKKLNLLEQSAENAKLLITQDWDGMLFVDYLQEKLIRDYDLVLLKEIGKFEERLLECNSDVKIMQKLIWHSNYIESKLTVGDSVEKDEAVQD